MRISVRGNDGLMQSLHSAYKGTWKWSWVQDVCTLPENVCVKNRDNCSVHPKLTLNFPKSFWHYQCFFPEREVLREGETPFHTCMKCQRWVTKVCVATSSASCTCGKFADPPDLNLGDTRMVRCSSWAASALRGLCSRNLQAGSPRVCGNPAFSSKCRMNLE